MMVLLFRLCVLSSCIKFLSVVSWFVLLLLFLNGVGVSNRFAARRSVVKFEIVN